MENRSTDRRTFLKSGAGTVAASLLGCSAPRGSKQPNIVIVIADDLAWRDIGCYGATQVSTPHIDKLAAEGMRFERAFTATAMCAPMRQQMYTGIFPVRNGAYPNHSQSKPGVKSIPHYFAPLGYRVALSGKKHFGPPENYPFEFLGEGKDIDYAAIDEFIARDPEQPYFLVACSNEPHLPWNRGDAAKFDPAAFAVPPYLVDTPETRQAMAAYYAEIEYLDGQTGRLMAAVEKSGQADNTIFIFCSEQGVQFPHGKWTCYDLGLRQGWIVRWPARVKAGSTAKAMVQGVDALPTLLEAAGGDPAVHDFDGRSYLAVLEGGADRHADYAYGAHTTRGIIQGSRCYPVRSVRDERHKLIWNTNYATKFQNILTESDGSGYWSSWVRKAKTDAEAAALVKMYQQRPEFEFYDVVADPFELTNLVEQPEHAQKIALLKAKLDAWMEQQGDKGNETELAVKAHKTGIV